VKCLKEPLPRLANRQDKKQGAFFEARFRSVAVVDQEALLNMCLHRLEPRGRQVAQPPETSVNTSIKQQVDHVEAQGKIAELAAAQGGERRRFAT
jgi:hypothetical protein